MNKSGYLWDLLHITKEKNATNYKTDSVSTSTVRKYFPRLPDNFSVLLNKFSEKHIAEAKLEITATKKKMGHDEVGSALFTIAFERLLHQHLTALRPLLPLTKCYHQTPSTEGKNRFKTAPCTFNSYTPGLHPIICCKSINLLMVYSICS